MIKRPPAFLKQTRTGKETGIIRTRSDYKDSRIQSKELMVEHIPYCG